MLVYFGFILSDVLDCIVDGVALGITDFEVWVYGFLGYSYGWFIFVGVYLFVVFRRWNISVRTTTLE